MRMEQRKHPLILVKHARPEIDPLVPAPEWPLSSAGREASVDLARRLECYRPTRVVTSVEPKAAGTGTIVAAVLGLPTSTASGLHEHDQGDVPFMGEAAWNAAVAEVFARPDEVVQGRESANAAADRFTAAVAGQLELYPDDRLVVVAHGRVISQAVARVNGFDAFGLWQRLGLPSFVVIDRLDWALIEVVEGVE
jgi:broad specificity phosphatase PhoE